MSDQSPSVPRTVISAHRAYIELHQKLESLGCDLRKPDGLWRRAEETLAAETSDRAATAADKPDLAPALRALEAAETAYSWYGRAIRAAGMPPPEVRTLAEPLDAALADAQRRVALLRRKIDSTATGLKAGENPGAPHMRLIHQAASALINVAADQAASLAREVVSILASDPELYADNPDRIPAEVERLIREASGLDFLSSPERWPALSGGDGGRRVGQAFCAVVRKQNVPAVEQLLARFFGRPVTK